ncbi:MAG: tRNA preQ1(34) S-adenosylmethionine ribosyltransferase-isomerase QueA [Usitatibacter sp.]
MHLSDFDYELPPELIAQHPAGRRAESRLLHLDGATGAIEDRRFADIVALLDGRDLLVVNDTRVIKARLMGRKDTGGEVEMLVERVLDSRRALAQVRSSKPLRPGRTVALSGDCSIEVVERRGEFFELRFPEEGVLSVLERMGEVPLPPYITHRAEGEDEARYQTVYAREPGAVAAPTAGLHFDEALLAAVRAKGVEIASLTLHVGAGTFQPVRVEDLSRHVMHSEWYGVPDATVAAVARARERGGRVVAVGTTALRALESAAAGGELRAGTGETRLFIVPGYRFRVVERLVTNFHLPKSTLLMLVSAFAGVDEIRRAYAHAVEHRYRFFSYGDAMLLERKPA